MPESIFGNLPDLYRFKAFSAATCCALRLLEPESTEAVEKVISEEPKSVEAKNVVNEDQSKSVDDTKN